MSLHIDTVHLKKKNYDEIDELRNISASLAKQSIWSDQAIKVNAKIAELDPTDITSRNRLAKCYIVNNEIEKAILIYKEVLLLEPNNLIATNQLQRIRENKRQGLLKQLKEQERIEKQRSVEEKRQQFLNILNIHNFDGFHHYTDFKNFESIMKDGNLFSRRKAQEKGFHDDAEPSIIRHTSQMVLNSVRFYYKEKTPTIYINEGIKKETEDNGLYKAHMPIPVLFLFDESIINTEGISISNGGCGNSSTYITQDLEEALSFEWDIIFDRTYRSDGVRNFERYSYKEKTNIRNAEFLYPDEISIRNVKLIIFRSEADRKHAEYIFGHKDIFKVIKSKFNVVQGQSDKNYLDDYIITKTLKDDLRVTLIFNSYPKGYDHLLKIYYNSGKEELLKINHEVTDYSYKIETTLHNASQIDHVEYLMNGYVCAIWR